MTQFTADDMQRIMIASGGEPEPGDGTDISSTSFEDLGYDSLAVMGMAARIEGEFGVRVPDQVVVELQTPSDFVDYVNGRMVTA
jgi:act minimal PKS acyl carrier protein